MALRRDRLYFTAMQEWHWHIETADNYRIYGCTNSDKGSSPDRAIVMVHGLTGNMDEYQHKSAANFFIKHGYDVVRFDLYSDMPGSRSLSHCTLQTHAADLNTVIEQKASAYRKLFLIGHSYGGPTIMVAQPKRATALSLWDPSFDLPARWDPADRTDIKQINGVTYLDWGREIIIGEDMLHEARSRYGADECLALSKALDKPIQVVTASEGFYATQGMSWHSAGHPENERITIKGADHCFHNGAVLDDVLAASLNWFDRY
jgi:pimeloyl-ACP methyl ester carboxylesterase